MQTCAKYVGFFLIVLRMGCSNGVQSFLSKFLPSVRSLMVSISKWKGRWHWQSYPAAKKMYPTGTPPLWYVIILWLSWNVQLLLGTFCLFFLLRTMFHPLSKWFNSGMGIHIQCVSSGEFKKENSGRRWEQVIEGIFIVSAHYFGNKLPTQLAKGCQSKCHAPVCRICMSPFTVFKEQHLEFKLPIGIDFLIFLAFFQFLEWHLLWGTLIKKDV